MKQKQKRQARPQKARSARPSQRKGKEPVTRAPAAVGRVSRGFAGRRQPATNSRGKNMTITHRERFATVTTTGTGFEITSYALNPGLSSIFPWLAAVANRFDKYKFRRLSFHYTPQSAALSGAMTMAFDFDPNDPAPESTSDASTYEDYTTTSIWMPAVLSCDLVSGDKMPQKNTRPGEPDSSYDLNNYDVGNLYVMTEGAAAGVVGYIEVDYTLDLFCHQTQSGVGGKLVAIAPTAANMFGTGFTVDPDGFMPGHWTSGTTFTFDQPFQGVMIAQFTGTVITADWDLIAALPGVDGGLTNTANAAANSATCVSAIKAVKGTTITPTLTATTITAASYWFAACSYSSTY
jgi:hypothetical protein